MWCSNAFVVGETHVSQTESNVLWFIWALPWSLVVFGDTILSMSIFPSDVLFSSCQLLIFICIKHHQIRNVQAPFSDVVSGNLGAILTPSFLSDPKYTHEGRDAKMTFWISSLFFWINLSTHTFRTLFYFWNEDQEANLIDWFPLDQLLIQSVIAMLMMLLNINYAKNEMWISFYQIAA